MEFVLEARSRQVQILEKKNKETPEMPQVFVFCKLFEIILLNCINIIIIFLGLLDSYRRLMAATDHLNDVIKPIEEYHLSKFNLTWRMMNQYLFHSRLYADRTIYHLVTTFVEQVCFETFDLFYFIKMITIFLLDCINTNIVKVFIECRYNS